MGGPTVPSRLLAAAALAVYAFVSGLLQPLHLLEERAPRDPAAAVLTADCGDRNCHAPSHGHGDRGHVHDASHCLLCGACAAPRTPLPPVSALLRASPPVAPVPDVAGPLGLSLRRGTFAARAPPAPPASA